MTAHSSAGHVINVRLTKEVASTLPITLDTRSHPAIGSLLRAGLIDS